MKGFGLWILLMVFATTLLCVYFSPIPGNDDEKNMDLGKASRKLMEKENVTDGSGYGDVDDYLPNDPVPSSKAALRPGPIEHGTPLMPYIPRSAPPSPGPNEPNYVGFP